MNEMKRNGGQWDVAFRGLNATYSLSASSRSMEDVMKNQINRKQLALIHLAKSQVKMSEEDYRAALREVGVESSKDLDRKGFEALMRKMTAEGFVGRVHASAKKSGMDKPAPEEKRALLGTIGALLADMKLPWAYADGIAKRVCKVEKVRWCVPEQLLKVVAALVYHQKRRQGNG